MESRTITGFRICVELCLDNKAEPRKCFIFVNKQWPKIKNVIEHIKDVFGIYEEIDIFVSDILLPENETLRLIQLDDILVIKKKKENIKENDRLIWSKYSRESVEQEIIPEYFNQKPRVSNDELISSCLQELRSKKAQIVKGTSLDTSLNIRTSLDTRTSLDISSLPNLNGDGPSIEKECLIPIPVEKKRKRKHKKKNKDIEGNDAKEEFSENKSDLISFASSESSSKHLHFSDYDETQESIVHSSPKKKEETVHDVRSSLLQLANKPVSEKIFPKKIENTEYPVEKIKVNGAVPSVNESTDVKMDVDDTSLTVPKVGDVIGFKKIKLGSDYTPQESGPILGEVRSVEKDAKGSLSVVFTILEGAAEFQEPSGKFSLELEENDENKVDKTDVFEMQWHEVLEPSLKKRVHT